MSQIRKFIPILSDYRQTVAIEKALYPEEEITIQNWKWHDRQIQPNVVFSRWVGEVDGQIVSHGYFNQQDSADSGGHFTIHIAVHPQHQNHGYGSELFLHLQRMLYPYTPAILESNVREDQIDACHFLQKRGFHEIAHRMVYRLQLGNCREVNAIHPESQRLQQLGIRITTLADLMDDCPDWQTRLFNLERTLVQDIPLLLPHFPKYEEQYRQRKIEQPFFDPHTFFIALYRDHWIGMAGIRPSDQNENTAEHHLLGVLRPYRRNGLATLFTRYCIQRATGKGYQSIECDASLNTPLNKILQKIGYLALPSWICYQFSEKI